MTQLSLDGMEFSRPATADARTVAAVADALVVLLVLAALPQPISVLFAICLFVAYHALLVWLVRQTPGKALTGITVVRTEGEVTLLWSLGRASVGYFVVNLCGLGIVAAFFDPGRRGLHDLVFGSVVRADEVGALDFARWLDRLEAFAARQLQAVTARKKTLGVLGGLWAFLVKLGDRLREVVQLFRPTPPAEAAPSALTHLSTRMVVVLSAATSAAVAAVIVTVPGLGETAAWLTRDRYLLGGPTPMIAVGDATEDDRDGDGLSDEEEEERYGTSPDAIDTDGDRLPDGFEVWGGLDPLRADAITADPDGDGLNVLQEYVHRTMPLADDTDGDGVDDGEEVARLSSPIDPREREAPPASEIVRLRLVVGDPSSSESERYNLEVGPYVHQATEFGVVDTVEYAFRRGREYEVALRHIASNRDTPDYDYVARIEGDDPSAISIDDPHRILGEHLDSELFSEPAGRKARLRILPDTSGGA